MGLGEYLAVMQTRDSSSVMTEVKTQPHYQACSHYQSQQKGAWNQGW